MAREPISRTAVPIDGLELTALEYETMVLGEGNGVECTYSPGDLIAMSNGTGGPAVYTIVVAQPATFSAYELEVPDYEVTVADGELFIVPVAPIFRQASGKILIDCTIAADIAILAMS